jgi:hypothetical protein
MLEIAEGLCEELGLSHAKELIAAKVEAATNNDASYLEFLTSFVQSEQSWRRGRW